MSKKTPFLPCSVALAAAALVAACGGGGGDPTAAATLQAQSARTQSQSCSYAHVWLNVTAVRVLRDGGGWQEMSLASPVRVDLLAASDGLLHALGLAPLSAGHVSQVRLVLASTGNSVQTSAGAVSALNVPSGESSGFKLAGDFTVGPSGVDVVLDGFDACASIVATGNGAFNLKPEAQAAIKEVTAHAGPEVPTSAGIAIAAPGGGWGLATQQGFTWTLQRFDGTGQPSGSLVSVTVGNDVFAWFAPLAGGGWAAVWIQHSGTLGVEQVFTQAWDAQGHALSAPTPVALIEPGKLSHPPALPRIAALAGGGYVVVWGLTPTDDGIYAQRFTAAGAPAAAAVRVAASGTGSLGVAGMAGGGYLVTWGRFGSTTGGAQALSASDVPLAPVQSAGSNGDGGGPPVPVVQGLAGGGAIIVWQAVHEHLMMQQVAPDGTPLGPAQVVDDQTTSPVFATIAVGALPDGGSVIAWADGGNVYARRYLASGVAAGPQTQINTTTTQVTGPVSVEVFADGGFAIRWSGASGGTTQPYIRTFPPGSLVG